jgi:hypothetical protein
MASKSVRFIALTNIGSLAGTPDEPRLVAPGKGPAQTFTEKQAAELAHAFSHTGKKGRPRRVDILPVQITAQK